MAAMLLCPLSGAWAKITLPHVLSDNMVLQRNTTVKLWGSCDRDRLTVTPSWDNKTYKVEVKDGAFLLEVPTGEAGGPYTLEFKDADARVEVKNILLGEVWFCSGQSNMEMPVNGFFNQYAEHALETMAAARPSRPIRMATVKKAYSKTPAAECEVEWKEHTPQNVGAFSATAYYFGEYLQEMLGVPVGLLVSCWGGSNVETWIDEATLGQFKEVNLSMLHDDTDVSKRPNNTPALLYNAMVAPVERFTVAGAIWYQGESNRGNPELYRRLMPAYVQMMRNKWGRGELPFYFVQIAPHNYGNPRAYGSAKLLNAQRMNVQDIPHSGMAVTLDIGDAACIHPPKKKEVGQRLAYWALAKDYGLDIPCSGPLFKSMEVKENKALVHFDYVYHGFINPGHPIEGLELAGEDGVYYPAKARIANFHLELTAQEVPHPVAVRYGCQNYCEATLFNVYGLPAAAFEARVE